ncbi:MAG: tRNA (adenosine(37)-N6)-threonylcarbamoyltransferase complex ATPase subunit type 1 TsaE [Candidatus Pacebacteria bacterium]|nr:tRNA (adenosine(37)-N6)-threonylcarbamoyltransferase complex ATPase subunit type 1 TsaE [Candidatus Paceibacterota bacterium]
MLWLLGVVAGSSLFIYSSVTVNESKNIFKENVIVKNLEELNSFARVFLKKIANLPQKQEIQATVIGLSGDLGAGKTTFSKCVASLLGVEEVVTSPTFGIQKQYKTNLHNSSDSLVLEKATRIFTEFVHIDAYRIEDIKEVETLRFVELFEKPNTLIFIEWPEKIAEVLPRDTIMLSFESIDENTRKISY